MPIIAYDPARDSTSTVFKTHLNYIKCIHQLTNGLTITLGVRPNTALDSQKISKFEKLADITRVSINGEKAACDNERAYAQIAAPWIPVKCYYRLYYLEAVLIYLLNGSEAGFGNGGHKGVRKALREALDAGQIVVNANKLAVSTDWAAADAFRATVGSTIRANYFADNDCPRSLRKKLAEYIELDWKQIKGIKDYRKRTAQTAKTQELLPKKFILLDYFYWMRIKANYRDVDFLDFDKDINERDAYEYLTKFIETTNAYGQALEAMITQLKTLRGMS